MGVVGPAFAKFVLAAGVLTFPADVNMHTAHIVLDPAVSVTAVSEDYARRLHLRRAGRIIVPIAGGKVEGDAAGPLDVKVGHAWFRVARAVITSLPEFSHNAGKADVIIGADTLRTTHLAVDFEKGELQAISDSDFAHATKRYDPVKLSKNAAGEPMIAVKIGDGPIALAKLDFASTIPMLMSDQFRSDRRLGQSGATSTGLAATPAGLRPSSTFSVPALAIHDVISNDVPAASVQDLAFGLALGLPVFEQYHIILDLGHDCIWLQPGKPKPFDRDLVGLTVRTNKESLTILHVAAHSPAEAAGMTAGTQITAIDGKPIDDTYYSSGLWRWRYGSSKAKISLLVSGRDVELTFRRFD